MIIDSQMHYIKFVIKEKNPVLKEIKKYDYEGL